MNVEIGTEAARNSFSGNTEMGISLQCARVTAHLASSHAERARSLPILAVVIDEGLNDSGDT